MIYQTIDLNLPYEKLHITHNEEKPTLTTYILDNDIESMGIRNRPLVLVCPGGGYGHLSFRESEAIAIRMNSLGYHAAILRYSLHPNHYPAQLFELATAVSLLRSHAKEWEIDPDKIIVCGFSAGGHLAASLGVMWNENFISSSLGLSKESIKPNGLLLCYPVITSGPFAHKNSFLHLLGDQYDALAESMSLENRVNKDVPPVFIWHTYEDASVPLENTLLFAEALRKTGIPFEYHVFPAGAHGLALCTKETNPLSNDKLEPANAIWVDLFYHWAERFI